MNDDAVNRELCFLGDRYARETDTAESGDLALRLYCLAYEAARKDLAAGFPCGALAEAALRLGRCALDGLFRRPAPEEAYGYFLEAHLAIRMRMAVNPRDGDAALRAEIEKEMARHCADWPFSGKEPPDPQPVWLSMAVGHGPQPCRLTVRELKGGRLSLSVRPIKDTAGCRPMILVTRPAIDYCALQDHVRVRTEPGARLTVRTKEREILFDSYDYDRRRFTTRLIRCGRVIAEIRTEGYSF